MRLEHNRICTWNSEVETGNIYLFTEGNLECQVKVVQTSQHKAGVHLSLKVTAKPQNSPLTLGEEFEMFASLIHPDKGEWWHLHDNELVYFQ